MAVVAHAWFLGERLILRGVGDAPPLLIEPPQIEQIGERLEKALDDVAIELKNEGSLR
jgi:hypothetical protein